MIYTMTSGCFPPPGLSWPQGLSTSIRHHGPYSSVNGGRGYTDPNSSPPTSPLGPAFGKYPVEITKEHKPLQIASTADRRSSSSSMENLLCSAFVNDHDIPTSRGPAPAAGAYPRGFEPGSYYRNGVQYVPGNSVALRGNGNGNNNNGSQLPIQSRRNTYSSYEAGVGAHGVGYPQRPYPGVQQHPAAPTYNNNHSPPRPTSMDLGMVSDGLIRQGEMGPPPPPSVAIVAASAVIQQQQQKDENHKRQKEHRRQSAPATSSSKSNPYRKAMRNGNDSNFYYLDYQGPAIGEKDPAGDENVPELETSLNSGEQMAIFLQLNELLCNGMFNFFARHRFAIPVDPGKRRVCKPSDREWHEWLGLAVALCEKRMIPREMLHHERIKEFITTLQSSIEIRHACAHTSRPLKSDMGVMQLISAAVHVAQIIKDWQGMREMLKIKAEAEETIERNQKGNVEKVTKQVRFLNV